MLSRCLNMVYRSKVSKGRVTCVVHLINALSPKPAFQAPMKSHLQTSGDMIELLRHQDEAVRPLQSSGDCLLITAARRRMGKGKASGVDTIPGASPLKCTCDAMVHRAHNVLMRYIPCMFDASGSDAFNCVWRDLGPLNTLGKFMYDTSWKALGRLQTLNTKSSPLIQL